MKLIPYKKLIFYSALSEDEIIFKLNQHVKKTYSMYESNQDYSESFFGIITPPDFFIYRLSKSKRNSFFPQIRGSIQQQIAGSKITFTMHLHPAIMFFWALIIFILVYGSFKSHFDIRLIVFTTCVYFMPVYFFNEECTKTLVDLQTILGPLMKLT